MRPVLKGSTDQSVVIRIVDSGDGTPETGVVFNTSGIDLWYRREGATKTSLTEAALSALNDAHSDGGVLHIGDGYYRIDLPDAAVASGANGVAVAGTVTGMVVIGCYVPLVDFNPYDAVRLGLTSLPNAAAEASGGLFTRGTGAGQINQQANGQVDTNLERWINVAPLALSSQRVQVLVGAITNGVIAAATFAANALDAVWSTAARVLTAGTNIALAKGTGVTGFNDLDAAGVRTAVGLASANLDTQLTTIDDFLDTEVAAIKAKTDNLPSDPADASDIAASFSTVNTKLDTIDDFLDTEMAATLAAVLNLVSAGYTRTGTAQAGAATTITLDASASAVDDFYNNQVIVIASGTGAGQARFITDYVGATKVASVATWATNPSSSSVFFLLPFGAIPGATAPTASEVADAVWDEAIVDHLGAGSTGAAVNAAGSAGDPWTTPLPGAYGAGTAGKIIGDNINATVSSRSSQTSVDTIDDFLDTEVAAILADTNELQTDWANGGRLDNILDARASQASVDDVPTNAELATALAAADDAVLAAIAALNNLSAAGVRTAVGLGSANLDTQLGDLPTNAELATALGTADDAVLAAISTLNNLSQANIRTAVGLASANLDTQLDALPTNAELATALGTADDAILAAIAALNNLSSAQVSTAISSAALATAANLALAKTAIDLIKAKTDSLAFTVAGQVDANMQSINDTAVIGNGAVTPWGV